MWCLPASQDERTLNVLHQIIVRAVTSVKELGLRDENDMTCLFPPDLMSYGLGEEIIIEIGGLFTKPERTPEVCQSLAASVGRAVKSLYSEAKVECFVTSFDPAQGFWTSAKPTSQEERDDDGLNYYCGVECGPRDPNR
ncbi:hypothetical protein KJ866_04415 [Patescibacteria group bacterium]|nr:hypothetical protein [Patescibacteria group bacterium]